MSWTVPQSSSPPSTPGANRRTGNSLASHPSTTPAGPPPSSTNSFTPLGPPPSSPLGSSRTHPQHAAFLSKPKFPTNMIARRDPNSRPLQTHQPPRDGRNLGNGNPQTTSTSRNFTALTLFKVNHSLMALLGKATVVSPMMFMSQAKMT